MSLQASKVVVALGTWLGISCFRFAEIVYFSLSVSQSILLLGFSWKGDAGISVGNIRLLGMSSPLGTFNDYTIPPATVGSVMQDDQEAGYRNQTELLILEFGSEPHSWPEIVCPPEAAALPTAVKPSELRDCSPASMPVLSDVIYQFFILLGRPRPLLHTTGILISPATAAAAERR
nr:hypothetical protein Iba_chr07fCG5070 [Ipomoea batatas]